MKNITKGPAIILILAISLIFFSQSCKKDDKNSPNNNSNGAACHILSLVDDLEQYLEIKFTYNGQKQLIKLEAWEDVDYSYKTMEYDNSGNIIRIEYYDDQGTMDAYQIFEYSGSKVVKGTEYAGSEYKYTYNYSANGRLESIDLQQVKSKSFGKKSKDNIHAGLLSYRIGNAIPLTNDGNYKLQKVTVSISFQWNTNGSVIKESWFYGGSLLESYNYTYDTKKNPFKELRSPVPVLGGPFSGSISANNYIEEIWYSVINGDSETTTATYQYNSNSYPISVIFDESDKYRMNYMCN